MLLQQNKKAYLVIYEQCVWTRRQVRLQVDVEFVNFFSQIGAFLSLSTDKSSACLQFFMPQTELLFSHIGLYTHTHTHKKKRKERKIPIGTAICKKFA